VNPSRGNGRARRSELRSWLSFTPGDSFLHSLDPRTKLLALIAIGLSSLFVNRLVPMSIIFSFVVALAVVSGLGRRFFKGLLVFAPLVAFVVLLDSFFAGDPTGIVYYTGTLWFMEASLTSGRIIFSLAMGLRLLSIGGFSMLLVMTTDYHAFVQGLTRMKVPRTFSFSLGYALKSTTALSQDLNNITDAQRSRGMEFDRDAILKHRNRLMAVTIPMTVSVLRRSGTVSDAMLCRGYGLNPDPTSHMELLFRRKDYVMAALCVLVLGTALLTAMLKVPP
jgi:energy-coupling factor transport system permease protein